MIKINNSTSSTIKKVFQAKLNCLQDSLVYSLEFCGVPVVRNEAREAAAKHGAQAEDGGTAPDQSTDRYRTENEGKGRVCQKGNPKSNYITGYGLELL